MPKSDEKLEEINRRFMGLPSVERRRLLNLIKWIKSGRPLNESLLKGFPIESKEILLDMLKQVTEEVE